ncbi:MAG: hypothetical protein H0W83_17035 [Planctomycetes bacterium]|nr:hypothetical protein [Planctomycetota bacterium]
MHHLLRRILAIPLTLTLGVGAYAAENGHDKDAKPPGETITLDKTPAAVKERIEKESKGGEVKSITKTTEDKKTIYIAEITNAGKTLKVHISESGKVMQTEEDGADKKPKTHKKD